MKEEQDLHEDDNLRPDPAAVNCYRPTLLDRAFAVAHDTTEIVLTCASFTFFGACFAAGGTLTYDAIVYYKSHLEKRALEELRQSDDADHAPELPPAPKNTPRQYDDVDNYLRADVETIETPEASPRLPFDPATAGGRLNYSVDAGRRKTNAVPGRVLRFDGAEAIE